MIEKTILAYTAGLLDGDGCIQISSVEPNNKGTQKTKYHNLSVQITNTNKEVINWLKDIFGGFITSRYSLPSSRKDCKTGFVWHIATIQAKDFLESIYPYLIIKKKQADLAIRFQENKKSMRKKEINFKLKEVVKRNWYQQEISKLNGGKLISDIKK